MQPVETKGTASLCQLNSSATWPGRKCVRETETDLKFCSKHKMLISHVIAEIVYGLIHLKLPSTGADEPPTFKLNHIPDDQWCAPN